MGQPEGRHFQPQDSNAVDFSHRPIERENQQDILGFATALLRRAPMTPIDRQIVSHSLKEIETVQQILLDWMPPHLIQEGYPFPSRMHYSGQLKTYESLQRFTSWSILKLRIKQNSIFFTQE